MTFFVSIFLLPFSFFSTFCTWGVHGRPIFFGEKNYLFLSQVELKLKSKPLTKIAFPI